MGLPCLRRRQHHHHLHHRRSLLSSLTAVAFLFFFLTQLGKPIANSPKFLRKQIYMCFVL